MSLVLPASPAVSPTVPAERIEVPPVPADVRIKTLPNGLTIIVREDHSAPVVSAQAWCRAGSIDEGPWLGAGLSHVLEHMLFKGTTTRGAGRIDQEVQAAGGYMNAYTSFDRTVYWINVPNTGASIALDILCDIMQHATLPPEELAKEMDVIRREMDMGQDDPGRRSSQRLFETAYTRSPYRYTIIGYPDIYNRLERSDIAAYYQEKYAPNNLFFVVAGDVCPDEVIAHIETAFASAKARPLPAVELAREPRQVAARELIEEAPIELAHLHFSWHIPELRHPDIPLLDVLSTLLGAGRSSRLFREIRERQALVASIEAWAYSPGNPGLLGISAMIEPPKFAAAREAILAEVTRLREEGVTDAEVAKAVKQFTAGFLATRKTMQGQAQDLGGNWHAAGDLNFSERYLAAVRRSTPEELRRVARQYLTPENRTLYALVPPATPCATAPAVAVTRAPGPRLHTLPNGLRLLLQEDHRLPFVEFRLVIRGGLLHEPKEANGVTQLLSRMLLQGTTTRSSEQIAAAIESVGGSLDAYGGNNSLGLNAEVLAPDFALGLELLADVLLHPAFPEEALAREREIQLAAIRSQKDQLLQTAFRLMRQRLFAGSGYGLDLLGEEPTVAALNRQHLTDAHHRWFTPGNAVLAVYGDINPTAVRQAIESAFASWDDPAAPLPAPATTFADFTPGPLRALESRDKKQAVLALGFPGTTMLGNDRYPLELIQEACSDLGSRLFLRIREKLGLAYYVGAQHFPGLVPGYFAFYAGTAPEHAARVEEELLKEAALLQSEGLSDEELERAKAKVIGQKKIARQELGYCAMTNALDELYGLGYTHLDLEDARYAAVTSDQVREIARKYIVPGRHVVALVAPAAKNETTKS